MTTRAKADESEALVPYHRLLSLRGQLDEIDLALRQPGRYSPPPLALTALKKALQVELDAAERGWHAPQLARAQAA